MRIPSWMSQLQERFLRFLPLIYIAYALPFSLILAIVNPPFDVPDEQCHFFRTIQISEGHLFASRSPNPAATLNSSSGGFVPSTAIRLASFPFCGPQSLIFDPKKTRENHLFDMAWDTKVEFATFPNTAVYPFTSYFPGAIGIAVGRMTGLSVLESFYIARVINAITSVLLSAIAIHLVSRGKVIFACILSLPMGIFLFSSLSQDAMVISFSALAVGLMNRYLDSPISRRDMLSVGILFLILLFSVLGRPAYLPFLFISGLIVYFGSKSVRFAGIAVGLSVALTVVYMMSVKHLGVYVLTDVYPDRQVAFILHHPFKFIHLMLVTTQYCFETMGKQFVGWFGWLRYGLPDPFYPLIGWMLGVALLSDFKLKDTELPPWARLVAVALACSIVILIYISLFIVWNNEKNIHIEGEQGRYYIPIALMLTLAAGNRDFSFMRLSPLRVVRFCANLAPLIILAATDFATCLTCLSEYYY